MWFVQFKKNSKKHFLFEGQTEINLRKKLGIDHECSGLYAWLSVPQYSTNQLSEKPKGNLSKEKAGNKAGFQDKN